MDAAGTRHRAPWHAECLRRERRHGLFLTAAASVLTPLGLVRDLTAAGLPPDAVPVRAVMEVGALLALVGMVRAHTLLGVRLANLLVHSTFCVCMAWLSTAPDYVMYVLGFSLLIWGPNAVFTWPLPVAVPFFALPPAAFTVVHLCRPHTHSTEEVAGATIYLVAASTVCTVSQYLKEQVARREFVGRHELAHANAELEASLHRLVQAQSQIVQSEKMAVLGQLVAGVAHELNTPLGAITASAETLERAAGRTASELIPALGELDAGGRAALQAVVASAVASSSGPMSSREERAVRRRLVEELEVAGVDDPRQVAAMLVEIGVIGDLGPHLAHLRSPDSRRILGHAWEILTQLRSASNIRIAAARADKIVFALKSYAHPGHVSGERTPGALAEHLDTVLSLYQGQLRQGVDVVREYAEVGRVWARHDQLNQVWTNLVHNALQAMNHSGTLTVSVHDVEGAVRVTLSDTGPGLPEAIRERIFEPFFTTKAMGEGTGLGLSICRDIVTAHGGTIGVTSLPGRTMFTVTLPRGDAPG